MKTIKVESCKKCLKMFKNEPLCAYEIWADYEKRGPDEIHSDCPLDNLCDCEPFQSCEKCAKKTVWKEPLLFSPDSSYYWILNTKTNFIKKGIRYTDDRIKRFEFKDGGSVHFDSSMYAEIKPPEPPK